MTIQQAIQEIDSKHKPYAYAIKPMTRQSYSKFMHRYKRGELKETAVLSFLRKFGYKINVQVENCV